jgi:hypothetical protein
MPSPLQSPSARRKLLYIGLIFAIFVVNTFAWRGVAMKWGGDPAQVPEWLSRVPQTEDERQSNVVRVLPKWTTTAQATNLDLTEETQGESDLLGSTVRLVLTGSRGLAVTILWNVAIDKQMKHEWNELEVLVRSLTKLQPHFLTPWLFQSWNLAYNVSVESDRVKDKYFYISRGIELLAQGERINKDNPDMRRWIGFYYQNKFGVSDEGNTLRSLFQLSCIPPEQRNPDLLAPKDQSGRRVVDFARFEQFCRDHPRLVRRLREPPKELVRPFKCNTPDEVVEFLEQSRRLPCRFVDPTQDTGLLSGKPGDLKPSDQQFPVLPMVRPSRYDSKGDEPIASETLDDTFDGFIVARAWFSYAQDPLPDPEPMTVSLDRKDRLKQLQGRRMPRQPAEILFRQEPCRAQSYVGEWLHKDGWFDDSGWAVDGGRTGQGRWFPPGKDLVVGAGEDRSTKEWARAFRMWREYAERNGLIYASAADKVNDETLAAKFRERFNIAPTDMASGFNPDKLDPEMRASLLAHRRLFFQWQNGPMTNFMHHYVKANAEQDRETAQARKAVDRGEEFRRAAEPERSLEAFDDGFARWKKVFTAHPDFRNDDSTQEEVYESELHYIDLVRDHRGDQLRPFLAFQGLATAAAASATGIASPGPAATGLAYQLLTDPRALPIPVLGPLDVPDNNGVPWIRPDTARTVRQRLNLEEPPAEPKPAASPAPPPAK